MPRQKADWTARRDATRLASYPNIRHPSIIPSFRHWKFSSIHIYLPLLPFHPISTCFGEQFNVPASRRSPQPLLGATVSSPLPSRYPNLQHLNANQHFQRESGKRSRIKKKDPLMAVAIMKTIMKEGPARKANLLWVTRSMAPMACWAIWPNGVIENFRCFNQKTSQGYLQKGLWPVLPFPHSSHDD